MVKTINIPRFEGMNNRLPEFALGTEDGKASFLRNAVNVNLTDAGTVRRRHGAVLSFSAADGHSLASDGTTGYYVDYSTLYSLSGNPSALTKTSILTGLVPGHRMFYDTDTPFGVLASNGDVLKQLTATSAVDFTQPIPSKQPILTIGTGALPAGTYQVAVCYVTTGTLTTAQHGGTTIPVSITLPTPGSLIVSGLDNTKTTAVYVTHPNGSIFLSAATGTFSSVTFAAPINYGPRCLTLLLAPMPPGTLLRYKLGRLLTVQGNVLSYSEPYAPQLYNPMRNFITFPAPVRVVEPVAGGTYVVADHAYWLAGDIGDSKAVPIVPYSAAYGASGRIPNSDDIWWMSDRGVIRGDKDGSWKNLQEENVIVDPAASGAVLFREEDGMKQMIASLFGPQPTGMAASTYMTAEVTRAGDEGPLRSMTSALTMSTTSMYAQILQLMFTRNTGVIATTTMTTN